MSNLQDVRKKNKSLEISMAKLAIQQWQLLSGVDGITAKQVTLRHLVVLTIYCSLPSPFTTADLLEKIDANTVLTNKNNIRPRVAAVIRSLQDDGLITCKVERKPGLAGLYVSDVA